MAGNWRALDRTHDPHARSWIEAANVAGTEFPLQNLPYGVFTRDRGQGALGAGIGVAIGDLVLDLRAAAQGGLLEGLPEVLVQACSAPVLNPLLALGRPAWVRLRDRIHGLLRSDDPHGEAVRPRTSTCLERLDSVALRLPAAIGGYTDFYASIHHATNVGQMMRPDNPLLPNYQWVPIGYHGRASSIVVSGTAVRRPWGQVRPDGSSAPRFQPTARLDYELEVAALIGPGNVLGNPIPLSQVEDHLFGVCLLNDWSARDVQGWEYQPLGPFLAKNFATSLSPWVVTCEALRPYRVASPRRGTDEPPPLPYLENAADREAGGLALSLEVWLTTEQMRRDGLPAAHLTTSHFAEMYWTVGQMIAHHTAGGCNLCPGDVIASGTVSGPSRRNRGCLLELTWRGTEPVALPTGESRGFLEDGDEVTFRGRAEAPGHPGIGLGECRGRVEPARPGA